LGVPADAVTEVRGSPAKPRAQDDEGNAVAEAQRVPSQRTYVDTILRRNIFDHTVIGASATATEEGGTPISDLRVRLLATMVAEPAEFSSALLVLDNDDSGARGYGIGDTIEGATIVEIEPKRVTIERDGQREVITMGEEGTKTSPSGASKTSSAETDDEGIGQVDEFNFEIERETLDKYLGDLDGLSRMGRARPHKDADGKVDGYRLSGIRRNSIASQLGIKNGDVVHAVNGHNLTSMKEAMDAWQSLQSEGSFSFDVTRRGKRNSMNYTVK
jgi:type II secretion system protein C